MLTGYSTRCLTRRFAHALTEGLRQELVLTPKPGLVDRHNNGSHADLDFRLMQRSVDLLNAYFIAAVNALDAGADITTLRDLGIATEQRMQSRFGTNTHRGAIFLGGLLLDAVHLAGRLDAADTRAAVVANARRLFGQRRPVGTVGAQVRARFGVGGIVEEALAGLPNVFETGAGTLLKGAALGMSRRRSQLLALAALMQRVEDTTALRRCGTAGLKQIRHDGQRLEAYLLQGVCPNRFLQETDRHYRARRLTMGGIADLLGMSIAWQLACEASVRPVQRRLRRVQPACELPSAQ